MSTAQQVPGANFTPPEPPRSGCFGKLVKGLGCGCAIVILLCCGGGVGSFYWLTKSVNQDPDQVKAVTQEIATIDIPASLVAKRVVNLKVPLIGKLVAKGVVYEDAETNTILVLGTGLLCRPDMPEQSRTQIENAIEQMAMGSRYEEMVVVGSETKPLKVKGEEASFRFTSGTGAKTHTNRIEVLGLFNGKQGKSLFLFLGSKDKYPEATLTKLIESIH
jgi:hypothetical protein